MPACIEIRNLTKYFGATRAIDDLTIEVNRGEVFGILGPEGSGKSTLISMLANLVHPTSGEIRIFGRELRRNFIQLAPRIGYVLDRPAFYEHLTVSKNLQLISRLSRRNVNYDRALDLVGLHHASEREARDLSRASRQRLALAVAFLGEPELLVLDDPASGLNPEQSQEILNLLRYLADRSGVTVLISSQMMHEVEMLCDRVAVLNQGRLVSAGPTDRLLSYDTTTLEILVEHTEALARRLKDESWVESVEVKPGRVVVKLKGRDPHQLIAFLVEKKYPVSGIIPRRRTLQEYFLKALNV